MKRRFKIKANCKDYEVELDIKLKAIWTKPFEKVLESSEDYVREFQNKVVEMLLKLNADIKDIKLI